MIGIVVVTHGQLARELAQQGVGRDIARRGGERHEHLREILLR